MFATKDCCPTTAHSCAIPSAMLAATSPVTLPPTPMNNTLARQKIALPTSMTRFAEAVDELSRRYGENQRHERETG